VREAKRKTPVDLCSRSDCGTKMGNQVLGFHCFHKLLTIARGMFTGPNVERWRKINTGRRGWCWALWKRGSLRR